VELSPPVKRCAFLVLALCGCAEKIPPPPPALTAALAATSASVEQGKVITANTVSTQLQAFAGDQRGLKMNDRFARLALESEALKGLPAELAKPYWRALEPRIRLALDGKDPGPGPRFRPDLPLAVTTAIGEVDNALRDHNLAAVCTAADQVTMELADWSWSTPAPRMWQKVRAAVEKLDKLPETCRDSTVSAAKETIEEAFAELRPY
jgi:hypothetical protein